MIDKAQWREFGQDTGVTPLQARGAMGFVMTTESKDLSLMSHPKDSDFLQYIVPITILGCEDPHRPQSEYLLLASLTPFPAAT